MKFTRPDLKLLVLCIASLIFLVDGGRKALVDSCDFVPVYTGARCLLHGCNPYDTAQLNQQYFQSGGRAEELVSWPAEMPMYPPSTLLVLTPLALFRYPVARLLWFLLNGLLFVTAAGLVLSICPRSHRWLATILISFILVMSRIQLGVGQPSNFAISLLVIGFYFLFRDRYLPLGALLLMFSIAVKPQIGGLLVLYLIARGFHRRYAMAALAGALVLLLTAGLILSLHPRSVNWASDLTANISATGDAGGNNDPRPANVWANHYLNLQAITSIYFADAREINAAAYAVFLALLAVWITAILRTKAGPEVHWLFIASLSALSLTPFYHRFYDSRILLITVPAVVIVYQKRRLLGTCIYALTALIIYSVSLQVRLQSFFESHGIWQNILQNKILFILCQRQQCLGLPILFCLYMAAIFSIRSSQRPSDDRRILGAALSVN
jgi:hypothetical protein